jgi:phospholipase C
MMENHAYDNYFETYCLKLSPFCNNTANGVVPGTCVPQMNVTGGCVVPYPFTAKNLSTPDIWHVYNSSMADINGGKMNGFYSGEKSGNGHGGVEPRLEPFGYYNGSTIPVYWDMAQEFEIGDNFYSSALSYSLPNHWYLIAGQAPQATFNDTNSLDHSIPIEHKYLNESNSTRTVEDLLNNSGITFRYYDAPLTTYQKAIKPYTGSAYGLWNPMAAKSESYTSYFNSHFVARNQIFTDLKTSKLPNIAYVIPQANFSDHPPANISLGEAFVANVVDAVEFSSYWNSTAIFLMWDDYGGFYDNQAPPKLDPLGLSFRVPFIVISPYTPEGRVNSHLGYFESTLSFIEFRWGLKKDCLTARDCKAPDLASFFNFNMKPRAPVFFDPNWTDDTYPYHFEAYKPAALQTTMWVGDDSDLTEDEAD